VRHGAEVYIVASEEALRFITRDTLAWSVGGRLITEVSYLAEHIYLLRDADLHRQPPTPWLRPHTE